jgi:hypothetical protein
MASFTIQGGAKIEIPQRDEIRQDVRDEWDARERQQARAFKSMRLPLLTGKAASSALSIGQALQVGPDSGYAWSLRRVIVNGLTTGVTPDVVNLYVNDTSSQPLWQFNGNNFGYTFGKLELVINPGEVLLLASVGTFAATGLITLSGSMIELPAEMLWKLA